jgi:hypothetical protein
METVHNHAEDLSQNSLSDPDIWGRLIEYRKEVQWTDIINQVERLESGFDRNEKWMRANEPCVDQYGQVWMVWENLSADPSFPRDRYQVYKISDDKDDFKYVFVDALEIVPMSNGANYQFSVGFDNFGETEIINIFTSNGNIEDCHFYSWERQLWERYEKWAERYRKSTYDSMGDLESFYRKYDKMQGGSFNAEEKLKEIYYRRKRIQRKLGAASIENLAIAA